MTMPNSTILGVLFDLDGTLVDTAPDLVAALNLALHDFDYPSVALEDVRDAASNGSLALITAAQPTLNAKRKAELQQALLTHYQRINGDHARLFDGITEVLHYLMDNGIAFGVVTNKAARFARPLLATLRLGQQPLIDYMSSVISGDTTTQGKPAAAPMLLAAQQLGCHAHNIIYIGDARRDLEAAQNSHMVGAIAMWGYIAADDNPTHWPHQVRFDKPQAIIDFMTQASVSHYA